MTDFKRVGFIGLGVMGEPMCRNLAVKGGRPVIGYDNNPAPLARLAAQGVVAGQSLAGVMNDCDLVFLSLPSGEIVEQLAVAPDGLLAHARAGQYIVDLSTSPVSLTRRLSADFAQRGATFLDAPVARTRAAAEAGTLSIMVGASQAQFDLVRPLLATFASEVTLCGPVGCGQVVKILNNMVLFETVVALSEACAIGRRAGVEPRMLLETFSLGSADSFALRNHGLKAILPREFPAKAFPVDYARKDLRYALALAQETGVAALGAQNVDRLFDAALAQGHGDRYFPVISRVIDAEPETTGQP